MIKLLLSVIVSGSLISSCNLQEKTEKQEKAQIKSDYIIENFDNEKVRSELPETFAPDVTNKVIHRFDSVCDWENRNEQAVDFFTMNYDGKNSAAYLYEFFLKCDSLRIVFIYDMEPTEPELLFINFEPMEMPRTTDYRSK